MRSISLPQLFLIVLFFIHPPGLIQTKLLAVPQENSTQSNESIVSNKSTSSSEHSFLHTIKHSANDFLGKSLIYASSVYSKVDPYLKLYSIHILVGMLLLGFLLVILKNTLKAKPEKEKSLMQVPGVPSAYFGDNLSNKGDDKIALIGRKNKKPKLDVDYASVFKPKEVRNKKGKIEGIIPISNTENPLFEYTNKVANEEQFNERYYTNNYCNNYSTSNNVIHIEQTLDYTNPIGSNNSNYLNNSGYNSGYNLNNTFSYNNTHNSGLHNQEEHNNVYHVSYNFDDENNKANANYPMHQTTEVSENIKTDSLKTSEFDLFEAFTHQKQNNSDKAQAGTKGESEKKTATPFSFSNSTTNVVFMETTKKEKNVHDDFLDFFSEPPVNTNDKHSKRENSEENTQEKLEKRKKQEKEKESFVSEMIEAINNRSEGRDSSNVNCLRREYQPPMEKIDEAESRKESEEFSVKDRSNSHTLHSSEDNENSMELNEDERIIKKLKKMNLKRCMIKI